MSVSEPPEQINEDTSQTTRSGVRLRLTPATRRNVNIRLRDISLSAIRCKL